MPRLGQGTPSRLHVRRFGRLPAPLQLPAATRLNGGRTLVAGGFSAADVSTVGVTVVSPTGAARVEGRLPLAVHDAAAATVRGHAFMLGGAGTVPTGGIFRWAADGRALAAGRLPTPASDVAAAAIGKWIYVIGGYAGAAPLRSIVAW